MLTVDFTPRLACESKPQAKDTFLFDRTLPGFDLCIHPSGRKVWIVQAGVEGRSHRIVIVRHGEMELAEACRRARGILARIRAGDKPADGTGHLALHTGELGRCWRAWKGKSVGRWRNPT